MNVEEKKLFSIVVPVYKSEPNLPITVPYIIEKIPVLFPDYRVELILVNDGSPDNSWKIMKEYHKLYPETIRIAGFTRNFGQARATYYGISMARGDFIGVISADLQDPFELFANMLKEAQNGYDLVCAVRENREETGLNVLFAKLNHYLINHLISDRYPIGGFDFFVLKKETAQRFIQLKERNSSTELLLLWVSETVKYIPYCRQHRQVGESGWTFAKKIKYVIDTFVSNSYLPIRFMSVVGIVFAMFAFCCGLLIVAELLIYGRDVPGWASLVLLVTFSSGLILLALGIIGEYLWRIYDELKNRPLYMLKEEENSGSGVDGDGK